MSHELILHHYDSSPFSEKVRLVFGLKGLSWRSVLISNIMPRPDLMPMTGGYRRTPVLQIGADIFCDTQMIVRELERRFPRPSLFPDASAGVAWVVGHWSDRPFFQTTVGVVFGSLASDALPRAFIEDREQLTGGRFDHETLRAALPTARDHWRSYALLVEAQLAAQAGHGADWLVASEPSYADVAAYMNFWFLTSAYVGATELMRELPQTRRWLERVRGLGHGNRLEMGSADALAAARDAEPATVASGDDGDPNGRTPGERLVVTPDDYGRVPVSGELVSSSAQHVALLREDQQVGRVVVHFPRAGFQVTSASRA